MDENITVRDIQLVELGILEELIPIFEKYDIDYALYYGSLIGAVRHKGFIPWDDDLDIVMTREDYNKLMSVAQKELPEYLFLQDYTTDAEYPSYTAKIRDSRTTMIENGYRRLKNMNHGMWIDIFILDYCDESVMSRLKCLCIKALQRIVLDKVCAEKEWKRKILSLFVNQKRFLSCINKLATELDKKNKHKYYILEYQRLISVEKFVSLIKVPFEDIEVKIPADFDYHLRTYYGDYMKLPSESEQKPAHLTDIVSVQESYATHIRKNT